MVDGFDKNAVTELKEKSSEKQELISSILKKVNQNELEIVTLKKEIQECSTFFSEKAYVKNSQSGLQSAKRQLEFEESKAKKDQDSALIEDLKKTIE